MQRWQGAGRSMALPAEPGQSTGRCQPECIFRLPSFLNLTELQGRSSTAEKPHAVKEARARGRPGAFPSAENSFSSVKPPTKAQYSATQVLRVTEVIKYSAVSEPQTVQLHDSKERCLSKTEPTFFYKTCDILDTVSERSCEVSGHV